MPNSKKPSEQDQKIALRIVVSGNPVDLEANIHQPLKSLMERAFKEAGVIGGGDNWYFTDENGSELDAEKHIAELGLQGGQVILLNQRAGAAG